MHTAAMLDYECLNCSWVKAHILDESIDVTKYGDGHLNQVSILKNGKVMAIFRCTSSYIWRPCWFSIRGSRWEFFSILFDIRTVVNVGIDTKTKSLGSLKRKIYVIE